MNWEKIRDVLLVISWSGLLVAILWLVFIGGMLAGWWP